MIESRAIILNELEMVRQMILSGVAPHEVDQTLQRIADDYRRAYDHVTKPEVGFDLFPLANEP